MNMMEFEEIQKVWNEQKGENMYVINESTLHKNVIRKKNASAKRIEIVETILSILNSIVFIVVMILTLRHPNAWGFINAAIVGLSVVYIRYFRAKRKKSDNTFDRSMLGELDHAISNANFIIRFNYLLLVGYILPMAVVCISSLIAAQAGLGKWLLIAGMFLLSVFLIRWEQKVCNVPRKAQLLDLKKMLTEG